jgi:hypothetical protein
MLLTRTAAVTILHRGPYSKPEDADPLVWGDRQVGHSGELIEKLMVLDEDGGIWDNLTLDPTINGEAAVGSVVELGVEIRREQKVGYSQSGSSFVVTKDKYRVVDVHPVGKPAGKPAQ